MTSSPTSGLVNAYCTTRALLMHHSRDRIVHAMAFVTVLLRISWNEKKLNESNKRDRSDIQPRLEWPLLVLLAQ